MSLPKRQEVPIKDTWDLTRIFKSDQDWEASFNNVKDELAALEQLKQNANSSAENLYQTITQILAVERKIERLYSYASLSSDVDTANNHYLAYSAKVQDLVAKFEASTAFLKPAILAISESKMAEFEKQQPRLKNYQHFLDQVNRMRPHTLSAQEEKIIADGASAMSTSENTFNVLSNSDLEYGYVEDENGEMVQLSDGLYSVLIQSKNRRVRKMAFDVLYASYGQFQNTFASTLSGVVKKHNYLARQHHYQSARDAALDENGVDPGVYDTLIKTVNSHLNLLHRYTALRKKILGLKDLQMWDLYVPLTDQPALNYDFEAAKQAAYEALKPLGSDYLKHVDYIFNNRVIDPIESQNKVTGAYSGGSYDTDPYELLNWENNLDSLYTLVHETGHSVHSWYTRHNQPYIYGDYPIFVAEIASTTNENILTEFFLDNLEDPKMRAFILNYYLDSFKGTLFRQTQFAEFEQFIHQADAQGEALTSQMLDEHYAQLNERYYGKSVASGSDIDKEWARIPHFYYNFYVYQYATGFAAATSLANKIVHRQTQDVENYLNYLKAGSSDYPINIMKKAGIDMTKADYLEDAFATFEKRLNEFEELIEKV